MNFSAALDYLYGLGHETLAMKFGLQNTRILLAAFNNPQHSFLKVQIAGTNGKGSVCAFLDAICRSAKLTTGLYTSPHLIKITERIKINGLEVTPEKFADLMTQVRQTAENLVANGKLTALPTFFEHLTVMALLAFREAKVDVAILETGLGGRLDATTAADAEIAGITQIALDHQEYLGETLAEIAAEKAAIIRRQTRVVAAPRSSQVRQIILARCVAVGNYSPHLNTINFKASGGTVDGRMTATFRSDLLEKKVYKKVVLGLRGRHQLENAALAINLAETLSEFDFKIESESIVNGLQTAVHAGRLELWRDLAPSILFDGAHNAAGARALRKFLQEFYGQTPLTIVFGAMRDKDLAQITAEIFPLAQSLILTPVDNPRSAALEYLQIFSSNKTNTYLAQNVTDALQRAQVVTSEDGLICVTGSLYLVGEAQKVWLAEKPKN